MTVAWSTWLAALVVALLAPTANAKCARTEQQPKILTTRDTKLPEDGGILVGWQSVVYNDTDAHPTGDPSDQPTWTATSSGSGKIKYTLTREALAPGLSVYRFKEKSAYLSMNPYIGAIVGPFTHDALAGGNPMSAPSVGELVTSIDKSMRWQERRAVATLKKASPIGSVAIIVYAVTSKGNQAISFVTLPDTHDTLMTLDVFEDAGHCGSVVDGSRPPNKGEKIAFAWVDAFGRLSPVSAAITAK